MNDGRFHEPNEKKVSVGISENFSFQSGRTHRIAFFEKKFGKIRTILTSDTCNEGYFAVFFCHLCFSVKFPNFFHKPKNDFSFFIFLEQRVEVYLHNALYIRRLAT